MYSTAPAQEQGARLPASRHRRLDFHKIKDNNKNSKNNNILFTTMNSLPPPLSAEIIRRKKLIILFFGVILYFLTSMAKLLVPAIVYDDLIAVGLNAAEIAGTGAAFMYAYAASQLLAGVFSNRYGGVRILLIGGGLFAAGTIGFPLTEFYWLMIFFRICTGLGAGTVFLGVVKLLSDLFSQRFAFALGVTMLFTYFGPVCGTTPMVLLTDAVGWQWSMMIPGIIAALSIGGILLFSSGTIKPVQNGETLQPLKKMFANRAMWLINLTIPLLFGSYYVLSSQLGAKSLTDRCGITAAHASTVIMILTIIVALNNVLGNLLLKLCGNRSKVAVFIAFALSTAGAVTGYLAFSKVTSVILTTTAFILIAVPAGWFPVFGNIAKELNPPEDTGLAVALLNFWCFVFIALFQNISGRIIQYFSPADAVSYPPEAYCGVFIFMALAGICGMIAISFHKESRK
ncbi:MAG: MFS transporter [Lentisphaerae bacterium]|nr:MFS transporter [Lentisphaerota bacterium]